MVKITAGIQPSLTGINANAGQIILNARDAMQQITFFNDYLNNLGQAGLVALGYSSADAALLLAIYGNMAAVVNMVNGQAYAGPALPFNFLAQTIPLWGGS